MSIQTNNGRKIKRKRNIPYKHVLLQSFDLKTLSYSFIREVINIQYFNTSNTNKYYNNYIEKTTELYIALTFITL